MSDEASERSAPEPPAAEARGLIALADGWRIGVARRYHYHIHAGLLAGLPDEAMNRRRVHGAVGCARQKLGCAGFPRLIPPRVNKMELPARPLRGPRAANDLPSTTRIGEFVSNVPAESWTCRIPRSR